MPQSSQPITAQSFTFFPRLPREIQLMVYEYMMPGPRRVHMTFRKGFPSCLGSSTPPPILLHLNRDARYEALKKYKLHFGSHSYGPNVFFNPAVDTLYFGPDVKELSSLARRISPVWPCYRDNYQDGINCRRGCGHHELVFFWKNVARECSTMLLNIGLDLRMNEADIMNFLHSLIELKALQRIVVYYPRQDGGGSETTFDNNGFLFGWKMWRICAFVKTIIEDERFLSLEVEQLPTPGTTIDQTMELRFVHEPDKATLFFQKWLMLQKTEVKDFSLRFR